MTYHRVLLKLSGEMLGSEGKIFDFDVLDGVARVLREIASRGVQIGVVTGAGNIWRGRQGKDMNAVTADQMGMLATVVNCLALKDAVERVGGRARVFSAIDMPRVCRTYRTQDAEATMESGCVTLFAGGSGNPFFSTDTAVALRAVELRADAILLAKNIDGVYDSDPKQNADAKLLPTLTYESAQRMRLKVMDAAAFALCAENKIPVVRVFKLDNPNSILRVLDGDPMGSTLTPEG